jgi:hypothetical protein
VPVRRLVPILALLACLFCPTKASAQLTGLCGWSNGTSNTTGGCSGSTSANQILVVMSFMNHTGITAMTCTGGSLTWTTDSFVQRSDGAIAGGICSALSGAGGTVPVVVTFTGSSGSNLTDTWMGQGAATTKVVDSECHTHGTIGASPLTGCAVTPTLTAELIVSFAEIDKVLTSSTPYSTFQINTGGSFSGLWGAFGETSGAPGSSTATYAFSGGSATVAAVNTVAYKLNTSHGASTGQPSPYIIRYHPPEKFTPLVLYTILRNWFKESLHTYV